MPSEMNHELKILPEYFEAVLNETKTFEIRFNDRGYKTGDTVTLREYHGIRGEYTGRSVEREIGYIFEGGDFGLNEGNVAFSLIKTFETRAKEIIGAPFDEDLYPDGRDFEEKKRPNTSSTLEVFTKEEKRIAELNRGAADEKSDCLYFCGKIDALNSIIKKEEEIREFNNGSAFDNAFKNE